MKWNPVWRYRVGMLALAALWPALPAQAQAGPAAAAQAFECAVGDIAGVPPADAQTAVGIVCRDLALASGRVGRYRVALRPLGHSVIVEVERCDVPARQTATLTGIEEVATAAPRLAEALMRNAPLVKTQRVDTLLLEETRRRPLKQGRVSWGFGVLGLQAPGQGVSNGGGFSASLAYNAPSFSVPVQFRVAGGGGDSEKGAHLTSFDVGARWFLTRQNISPFVGGGLGWLSWNVEDRPKDGPWRPASYSGAAPYVEAGCEMLRLHRARVTALVRVDLPLASLEWPETYRWEHTGTNRERPITIPGGTVYAVPLTVGLSVAF